MPRTSSAVESTRTLYTGVLYRNPSPDRTYEEAVGERQRMQAVSAVPHDRILDAFVAG